MIKVGIAVVAAAICGASVASAAEHKLDSGSMALTNNTTAIAAVKADDGMGGALSGKEFTNSQLSSEDRSSDSLSKAPSISGKSLSALPDEGSVKKGVVNTTGVASSLASNDSLASPKHAGSGDAAQVDAHDLMK